jgi:AraC family transcriptional regulator of adaptative response/methylated-DNA-[protein]-cysteine methyltransferase
MNATQTPSDFSSAQGLQAALEHLNQSQSTTSQAQLTATRITTPLGPMVAVSDGHALRMLEFGNRRAVPTEIKRLARRQAAQFTLGRDAVLDQIAQELAAYFAGQGARFHTPLAWSGRPFAATVWTALRAIPPGETVAYGELAATLGRPGAARAVARANGANELSIIVPCHRVIGADGRLTGYGGGLERKKWLLDHEKHHFAAPERPQSTQDLFADRGCGATTVKNA